LSLKIITLKTILTNRKFHWVFVLLIFTVVAGCNSVNPPEFGGTVKDIDGNEYHTVTIGNQTWMIENLKATHFADSTSIPLIADSAAWRNLKTPGYCWYNNDSIQFNTTYGALYNWYAVNSGKLAPRGWHVATEAEWATLESNVTKYLYTSGSLSKILAAKTNWISSTATGAIGNVLTINNSSGFNALPGGLRENNKRTFHAMDSTGAWWTSTNKSDTTSLSLMMRCDFNSVDRINKHKWKGLSVRCIKD
jgi:uncharacterized protein (TIGR02145 family)